MMHTKNNITSTSQTSVSGGFIAVTALVLLSLGVCAYVLATMDTARWYADSIMAREARIQRRLNDLACQDTRKIIIAKDYFWENEVFLSDFDCTISK